MGIPVVMYPQQKQSYDVIEKICREKKCELIKVPLDSAIYLGKENLKNVVITLMEGQVAYKHNVYNSKNKNNNI